LKFNDEQLRVAANLRQYYDAWLDAARSLRALGRGYLAWKTIGGKQYLYSTDATGQGTSLGPRSAESEAALADWRARRSELNGRVQGAQAQLRTTGALYRSLRLGAIASPAAKILREADLRGMLGSELLVVGTSAMAAYELEAGSRFAVGMDATEDFDLAWAAEPREAVALVKGLRAPVLSLLKAVDDTYVVNTERPFQARNRNAYEVEVLLAPSLQAGYPSTEALRPLPLPEQEWLLQGRRVDQVVCARDGTAARVVAPDPRWFALHKCWLADKPSRNTLKAPKDRRQGEALLAAIREFMPHYPLDTDFAQTLPRELIPYLER
jgi:hypothetical protein